MALQAADSETHDERFAAVITNLVTKFCTHHILPAHKTIICMIQTHKTKKVLYKLNEINKTNPQVSDA